MSLLKSIIEAQGGQVLKQLASNFNLQPDQAGAAVSQLLPALSGAMQKSMASPQGLEGLMRALQSGGHAKYIDNPAELTRPEAIDDGNGILGHLLGSKQRSREVAAQASQQTGIDVGILKKMLPMIAGMAMGGMSKQASQGGLLDSLTGAQAQPQQQESSGGGLLGGIMSSLGGSKGASASVNPGSILGKFLDADNDGSVLDDVMGFAKKLM